MKKDNHFVAICVIWLRRFNECSDTCMTPLFPNSVWRFYYSLLDLGEEELAIQSIVKKYVEADWKPKINRIIEERTVYTNDEDTINLERKIVEAEYIYEVFNKIKDTIQDSGVGWPTREEFEQYIIGQD